MIKPHALGLEKEAGICVESMLYWYGWKVPEMFTLKHNSKNPSVYNFALERPTCKMQLCATGKNMDLICCEARFSN